MPDGSPNILLVPGLDGSGPEHWQTRWESERSNVRRVEQDNWCDPRPDDWTQRLEASVAAEAGPLVLVAHSLGCATVAHWAARSAAAGRVRAALLVAPCDVEGASACVPIQRFAPMPSAPLPFHATVVASRDDPYISIDRARAFAEAWGAGFVDAGSLGHINAASKLGDWGFGQALLDELIATTPDHARRR